MDSRRWQRICAIFERAVELPHAEREALLARECGDDADLREAVGSMLDADAKAETFDAQARELRGRAAADWADWNATPENQRVGAWRIVREIGRGGMGLVFLVGRADGQFEQQAALKLIKRGMDSDAVLARFLRERQILARLAHRNIAGLLDGGIAPDGRPYFVMEYVDGVPLLRHCGERHCDLDERLRLFRGVCAAVQFAHRQLVVHADLKPSNVLVDANGEIKLLDFGIAKLLGEQEQAVSPTVTRDRPLTPAYAAPEQLRGEPITTATDVYALGCLLYELLTGQRPFRLHDAPTLDELRHVLDATGPVPPSQLRAADAPVPPQRLRGDLDTIALKALKREPDRRYATVDAFAEDVHRYLGGMPIAAHRDSRLYRARKFVARHWAAVSLSSVGAVVLAIAIGVALWQARGKAAEAQASSEVAGFLVGLFAASDPTHTRGAIVSAKDLLDQGAAQLDQRRIANPLLRARFLQAIATSYAALGLYDRALPLAERALSARLENLDASDLAIAESRDAVGQIRAAMADYATAEPLLRAALTARSSRLPKDDPLVIESLGHLGKLLQNRGDFEGADVPFREALDLATRRYGAEAAETARSMDDLATNLENLGKPLDAQKMYRQALAIRERVLEPNDPEIALSLHNLGYNLMRMGVYAEAQSVLERALAIRERIYGTGHPVVGETQLTLATMYEATNDLDKAEPLAQAALATFRRVLDENHRTTTESLNLLAILRLDRRDYGEAAALFRDAFGRYREALGDSHPDTLVAETNLATSLYYLGQLAEAEELQRDIAAKSHSDGGTGVRLTNLRNLARTLEHRGKAAEALQFVRESLDLQRQRNGADSRPYALALRELALAERATGDDASAEAHLREGVALVERLSASGGGTYGWKIPYADLLVARDRCGEALPLLDASLAELAKGDARRNPLWRPQADLLLAHCQTALGQHASKERAKEARRILRALPGIEYDLYPTARRLFAAE